MQFSEFEMTTMLEGVAKTHVAFNARIAAAAANGVEMSNEPLSEEEIATAWEASAKIDRYHVKTALSEFLLPVLPTLPEVTVGPGERATYEPEQVITAARESVEADVAMERLRADQADDVTIQRASITTYALGYLPLKPAESADLNADDFIVPDSPEGLI